MDLPKHLLVPTDLTEVSALAGQRAKAIADAGGARITVLHVVDYVPPRHIAHELPENLASESALVERARGYLDEWAEKSGLDKGQRIVKAGSPKRVIVEAAEELGVDLIVMSTQGERGIARIVGSTAHGVLRDAPCDVLVVHPH